jgi:hypothetical protein
MRSAVARSPLVLALSALIVACIGGPSDEPRSAEPSPIAEDPAAEAHLLAFAEACVMSDHAFSLVLLDLASGNSTRLAADEAGFWVASWSPDSRHIAASRTPGQLTLIDLDDSTSTIIHGADGFPATFFPAPAGWGDGWLVIRDLGGRDRCFV